MVAPRLDGRFPIGCIRNTKNLEIATKLSRIAMHVLSDVPPSVPQRGEPLVSILTSRKRQPRWERARLRRIRRRYIERMMRRCDRSSEGWSEEGSESSGEESSKEESIA